MFGKLWRRIANLPALLLAIEVLRLDIGTQLKSEATKSAWERFKQDAAIQPVVPRISAEWRAIEEALKRLN